MSESSKMGLFGSKDKNKEPKKESAKVESPDRYIPYCIDSDSETYDTEALSIMDINDIIGVQSEPVSDSTLESEIAALSQIITESKTEVSQNVTDAQCEIQGGDSSKDRECFNIENINTVETSVVNEQVKCTQEDVENISSVRDVAGIYDNEQLVLEKLQTNDEDNVSKNMELNDETSNVKIDSKDVSESSASMEPASAEIINDANVPTENERNKTDDLKTINDETNEEPTIETLESEEAVKSESVIKDKIEIEKHSKVNTGLPGNDLDMDFEGNTFESMADLEETETKMELAPDLLLPSVDQEISLNDTVIETETPQSSALLLEEVKCTPDITETSDYINDVISNCLTDTNNVSLETDVEKAEISETIDDNPNEEGNTSELLENNKSVIPESISKDNDVVDLQKDLEVDVNLPENDLDMDFKASTLESVTDLEETEAKLEIAPDILLPDMDQTENINDAPMTELETLQSGSTLLLEQSDCSPDIAQTSDYITDVISSCLTSTTDVSLEEKISKTEIPEIIDDKINDSETSEILKEDVAITPDPIDKDNNVLDIQKHLEVDTEMQENDLNIDLKGNTLESMAVLEETKLELAPDLLLPSVDQELSLNDTVIETETPQSPSPLLSEEVNCTSDITETSDFKNDVLSNCLTDTNNVSLENDVEKAEICETIDDNPNEEGNTSEILENNETVIPESINKDSDVVDLQKDLVVDANLPENDLGMDFEGNTLESVTDLEETETKLDIAPDILLPGVDQTENVNDAPMTELETLQPVSAAEQVSADESEASQEPAHEVESPVGMEIKLPKSPDTSTASADQPDQPEEHNAKELIQEEPNRTESPLGMKIKLSETDNVSIIQTEASEDTEQKEESDIPQDVKPMDSTSSVNIEVVKTSEPSVADMLPDMDQTENVNDAPMIEPEILQPGSPAEQVTADESMVSEETAHKVEIPIEMEIKLSTSEDTSTASTDQTDQTEEHNARELMQDSPKRTESPLEMKIKLSKTGDPSIIQTDASEDTKQEEKVDNKEKTDTAQDLKPTDSTSSVEIEVAKAEEPLVADIMLPDVDQTENVNDALMTEPEILQPASAAGPVSVDESEASQEAAHKVESPIEMEIKPSDFEDTSIISADQPHQAEEHKVRELIQKAPKRTESPLGMKIKLSQTGDVSIIQTDVSEDTKQEEEVDNKEKTDIAQDVKSTDAAPSVEIEIAKTEEPLVADIMLPDVDQTENVNDAPMTEPEILQPSSTDEQVSTDEYEASQETADKVESPFGMEIKLSESADTSTASADQPDQPEEHNARELIQEEPKRTESPLGMKIKLSQTDDVSIIQSDASEDTKQEEKMDNKEKTDIAEDVKPIDSTSNVKIEAVKADEPTVADMLPDVDQKENINDAPMTEPEALQPGSALLLEQSDSSTDIAQTSDYITDVISSCLTSNTNVSLEDRTSKTEIPEIDDKINEGETSEILKEDEAITPDPMDKDNNVLEIQKHLEVDTEMPENDLDMDFEGNTLESVADLEETESKLELAPDLLLQDVVQTENLNDVTTGTETSQPSSEISELESAVKFLEESNGGRPESVVEDMSKQTDDFSLFVPDEDMCEDTSELVAELQDITTDPISISEAEIISEAAKLESERKLAEQAKITTPTICEFEADDVKLNVNEVKSDLSTESEAKLPVDNVENIEIQQTANVEPKKIPETIATLSPSVLKVSESIPKISILEERLKEPPKIEIPTTDVTKVSISPTTSKDSLLIQKDAKMIAYQKMLESPKLLDKNEPKIMDTPRKDSEKHDFENVGSPRIILKIAKSAIADCGEPRSPKSPKIRSATNSPNPEDSPGQKLGKIKLKLSKSGHPSIISNENIEEAGQWHSEGSASLSPLGMKIKLSKSGDASIVSSEKHETTDESKETKHKFEEAKRTESPIGMKIKLSKSGDASIVQQDSKEILVKHKEKLDMVQGSPKRTESPIGMKIKLSKTGDASIIQSERQEFTEEHKENPAKTKEKIDVSYDSPKRTDSPIGMKIKLSKTGDASIVSPDVSEEGKETCSKVVESDKKERQQRRRDTESPLEMKIKLSKTGHPTIVACESHPDPTHKPKDTLDPTLNFPHRYKEPMLHKEPALKILKTGHSTILQSNRSELTIEPVQMQSKKADNVIEISPKRKEITISPIESKKSKLETQLSQILPEVTIQPVMSRDQKQLLFDPKTSLISRQQMNVISQEISITQVRPPKTMDTSMSEKLKDILSKNVTNSPMNSDCEIIEHRPELIIVNENSNSSQDVVIIEEVPSNRIPEVKVPKKRGRPRRNPLPQSIVHPPPQIIVPRDPLALDEVPQAAPFEHRENERPKRTCRNQKSYAPPRRGRGRGRGKRKLDSLDLHLAKKPKIEQDLSAIEASTMAVVTMDKPSGQESLGKTSELYKALKQPPIDSKGVSPPCKIEKKCIGGKDVGKSPDTTNSTVNVSPTIPMRSESAKLSDGQGDSSRIMPKPTVLDSRESTKDKKPPIEVTPEKMQKTAAKHVTDEKHIEKGTESIKSEGKDILVPPGRSNWLTPAAKRQAENASKHESMSTVQVIDEETRMSAESGSRSQTPARNISVPASETIVNEESQGSVLSTATTESEKVKVKNRRMEINFDPDEGPFTVDKIAEYEWPLDRKGETFMIQEQISQYLGVKSFKRKYPDLKRRMVDMEERNYLRENGLVSEAMCDMGLTAVCSSEVLDVMCSDFPDQYEEYRKHMREKQVKEHSKKQKELTAAANAEKNRIDLAEMAVQSALTWNINLNKARKENRKCSLDLQTFTIHVPKKQQKVETERKVSHYPVALIPGQYTDYYREYTAAELRYYPLNTVLYGPMRPNERKFDSQSEGSQSDSDTDSSSDDSSSSSSEGTQDTEGSQSTMDEVDMEIVNQKDEIKLKCKMCLKSLNKHNKNEVLIQCGTCNGNVHPSCIDLTLDMVPHIQSYAWQCTDCKTCAQCHDPADEDKMLFCDMCDRGYHIYCVGLRRVPQGRWHCQECAVCANCGSREPGGINSDRNSVAQWQHEYKKGDKNTRVYVSTLCVPCSKLWRKGRYCPHCSRCHTAPRLDLEANLVHCSACDKYLHLGCVETKGAGFDRKNYLCDFCTPNRQHVVKPLVSKIFKT